MLAAASIAPIRSYDYFWHLATGRWIVEQGRLPDADPFAVASDREPWRNGEWLFQVALYDLYRLVDHSGISVIRGLGVAALFTMVLLLARARAESSVALLLTVLCWYGADHRLTARPEAVATLFVVACCWIALARPDWWRAGIYVALTIVWINLHPSALLSPVIVAVAVAGSVARREIVLRASMSAAAALSLLANPYGLDGVLAPIRLARTIAERRFVNLEWLPSSPADFPLLYIAITLGMVAFLAGSARRRHLGAFLLFALFGLLAVRHLRNQGFFFATMPLLAAPWMPTGLRTGLSRGVSLAAGAFMLLVFAGRLPLETGIDVRLFPVEAVERLKLANPAGTIYNPDQFGGYLIWTFYPERRVLTDGRNELFDTYLRQYERARKDAREWRRLLDQYAVSVAVEEYRRAPIEVIDATTGRRQQVAASLAFFPRKEWALIGFDEVAMVFVRRDRVTPALLQRFEIGGVIPDLPESGKFPE